jgi:hypothetical protein
MGRTRDPQTQGASQGRQQGTGIKPGFSMRPAGPEVSIAPEKMKDDVYAICLRVPSDQALWIQAG